MVRKKGIFFLVALALLFVLLSLFFTDAWLESQLEDMGSSLVGARVELDGLDFSFTGAYLNWQRLQIADAARPLQNKIETGPCRIDFEFWPLLSNKIIIDDFTISRLRTNTPRETDGSLTDSEKETRAENSLVQKGVSKMRNLAARKITNIRKQANTDSLLKAAGLTSPRKIDALYARLDSISSVWEKRSAENDPRPKIKVIEKQIAAIDTKNLKDIKKLTQALEQTAKVKKSVDKLNREIKTLKKEFDADFTSVSSAVTRVNDWIKSDYNRAEKLLRVPDFSAGNAGRMLFGPLLAERFTEYLGYVKTARKYIRKYQSAAPKEKDPPRMKGQDIYFYTPNARPDFWIRNMHLSGRTSDSLHIEGIAKNIVSNQKYIGKPTELKVSGNNTNGVSLDLNGAFDYLKPTAREEIHFIYSGFSLDGASSLFPGKIKSGKGNLLSRLSLNGNQLKSQVNFSAANIRFEKDISEKSEIQRLLLDAIRKAERITVAVKIDGTIDKPEFHIRTNLDQLLTNQMNKRFGRRLKDERAKIDAYIRKQTASKRKKLEAFAEARVVSLQSVFSDYDDALQTQQKKLDVLKKELQKKLSKQKDKLGKDAVKKLKGLF